MKGGKLGVSKPLIFSISLPVKRRENEKTCSEELGDQFENYRALSNLGEVWAIGLFGAKG